MRNGRLETARQVLQVGGAAQRTGSYTQTKATDPGFQNLHVLTIAGVMLPI
ncbi:hypothetical protein ACWATR_02300 [Nostoc sp. UIC 10890]|jgi:hypothetical protein